jgi:ABC-type transporter Mla subunit MlaD
MKIDRQILDSVFLRPQTQENAREVKPSQVEDFAALLKGGPDQKEINPVPSGLDENSAALWANSLLGKIQTEQAQSAIDPVAGVEDEIGGVLDILEKYMTALGDPGVNLKEIAPLVDTLDRKASRLDKIASELSVDDPIKPLTNETAALAAVEALKFKRGDFV